MRTYEITYITLDEETPSASAITAVLSQHNAKIMSVHPWAGRRKLAYPIKKQDQAFYTTVIFEAEPDTIVPIERAVQGLDAVLRLLIVHFEPGIFHRSESAARVADEKETGAKTAETEVLPPVLAEEVKPETTEAKEEAPVVPSEEKPKRTRAKP